MNSGQRLIVELLRLHGGLVQRTQLMKLLFLLGHETPLAGPRFPYGFVPYHYGPFSFAAYRDLARLAVAGCVEERSDGVRLAAGRRSAALAPAKRAALDQIVDRFGHVRPINLRRYTYLHYPWYTVLSISKDPVAHRSGTLPVASPAVYTIGYEGRSIDRFLNELLRTGVRGVCDVRAVPASRSYGFHRKTLSAHLARLGLEYHPFGELGIPTELRRAYLGYGGQGLAALLAQYRGWLPTADVAVTQRLADVVSGEPLALLCLESDPADCHRSVLAEAIGRMTGLPVAHV